MRWYGVRFRAEVHGAEDSESDRNQRNFSGEPFELPIRVMVGTATRAEYSAPPKFVLTAQKRF